MTYSGPGQSIGRMLLDSGKLKPEGAERILRLQKERGLLFGEAALELGLITRGDIEQVLSHQFDYPFLQPGEGHFRGTQLELRRHVACPQKRLQPLKLSCAHLVTCHSSLPFSQISFAIGAEGVYKSAMIISWLTLAARL